MPLLSSQESRSQKDKFLSFPSQMTGSSENSDTSMLSWIHPDSQLTYVPIRWQAYTKHLVNSSFPFLQFSKALNPVGKKVKVTPTLLPLNFNALNIKERLIPRSLLIPIQQTASGSQGGHIPKILCTLAKTSRKHHVT